VAGKGVIPTARICVAQKILAKSGEAERPALLRLVPSPDAGRKTVTPDPEMKRMLDEMRRRLPAGRGRGGLGPGGKDAA